MHARFFLFDYEIYACVIVSTNFTFSFLHLLVGFISTIISAFNFFFNIGTCVTINSIQLDTSNTQFKTKYISSESLQ